MTRILLKKKFIPFKKFVPPTGLEPVTGGRRWMLAGNRNTENAERAKNGNIPNLRQRMMLTEIDVVFFGRFRSDATSSFWIKTGFRWLENFVFLLVASFLFFFFLPFCLFFFDFFVYVSSWFPLGFLRQIVNMNLFSFLFYVYELLNLILILYLCVSVFGVYVLILLLTSTYIVN